jgi:hypothetical protein
LLVRESFNAYGTQRDGSDWDGNRTMEGRAPMSRGDAETILDWAKEYNYPALRRDRAT